MEKISSTYLLRNWGSIFRMATERPYLVTSNGEPKVMIVPVDFKVRDHIDDLTHEDIPVTARYSPQEIFSWLVALSFVRLRKKFPQVVKFNMELALEQIEARENLSPSLILKLKNFVELELDAAEAMLLEDSDWGAHLRKIAPYGHAFGIEEVSRLRTKSRKFYDTIKMLEGKSTAI